MKKLLVLLFLSVFLLTCFAEGETYATAGDLYQAWAENYPDYICGIWSTDGGMDNLTFSVMNNEDGEKGKEEILALVENDATVTFEYGVVSRNYLSKVQEELLPYFEKDLGLISSGIYEMVNRICLGIHIDRADDPDTLAMLEELKEKYGSIFIVEYTEGISLDTGLVEDFPVVTLDTNVKKDNTVWFVAFGVAIILLTVALVVFLKKNRTLIKATNTGNITETEVSSNDVKSHIKNVNASVPKELDERIMQDIDK